MSSSKRSAICSGKLCWGFIIFEQCCPCEYNHVTNFNIRMNKLSHMRRSENRITLAANHWRVAKAYRVIKCNTWILSFMYWNMNNSETILMPGERITDWRWCNWFTTLFGSTWILIFADIRNFEFAMKCHMNQWLPWMFAINRLGTSLYFSFSREVLQTLPQKGGSCN